MPYDLAQSLQSLGVAAEAGLEIQSQIAAGAGNINALLEVAFVPLDAEILANGITAGTLDPDDLSEGSVVPEVARTIAAAINTTPVNTVAPALSGTPEVGETLTVTNGTWTSQSSVSYSREWLRDGAVIPGETGTTYLLDAADEDADISVRVTATNANGSTSALSNTLGPVVP